MAFRGVFIGIDRYVSSSINWLSCARRDAVALHALFTDNLGPGAELLTDGQATGESIRAQLGALKRCAPEDVVVISFSGHGSQPHGLVPYDCEPARLKETSISLSELADIFSQIPAKTVLCFLDCCFSGGAGAKVLKAEAVPRGMESAESLLGQMAGEGRIIFTASAANQPAWEVASFEHGVLTWYLIEALLGREEVVYEGRISLNRLFDFVSERVQYEVSKLGKNQHPAWRGQVNLMLSWPIFKAGKRFYEAFPDRRSAVATADIRSLLTFGFSEALLDAWASVIPTLNSLQLQAINEFGVLRGGNLLVSAPTSSGKTMIGELVALKGAAERRRAIFLLPLRALVNDKTAYFERVYGPLGLRTVRATGEFNDDIQELTRGHYDICLMTYEKFASLVIALPFLLDQVGTVVVDEVQMIADSNRGTNLEFILTVLSMRQRTGIHPQVIALSAVIGSTHGFERWLGGRLLLTNQRPVPLREGVVGPIGALRCLSPENEEQKNERFVSVAFRKGSSQDVIIPVVQKLVGEGKQVIVFRPTRGEARGCAGYLARELRLKPASHALGALPKNDLSSSSLNLHEALRGGVGFHTSDLDRDERSVLEEAFRQLESEIQVLVATTTLAMGVNTPAEAVVIAGLDHPGPQPYSVAEYKNMVGRAGRLGFAASGESYVVADSIHSEDYFWSTYVLGFPEAIESRFFVDDTDPRTLVLRVLVALPKKSVGFSHADVIDFINASFGTFQKLQKEPRWKNDEAAFIQALAQLERFELVERTTDDTFLPTALGRLAGKTGVHVESMIRLIRAIRQLRPDEISDPTLIGLTQLTVELGELRLPINRRSKEKEPNTWMAAVQRWGVARSVISGLLFWFQDKLDQTLANKKIAACSMFMSDLPMSEIERQMTQFGGGFGNAAGPVRNVASRTADLLETVIRTAEVIHPTLDLGERGGRLLARLQNGVAANAAEIAGLFGSALSRGDYQNLVRVGLNTSSKLNTASDIDLSKIVGTTGKVAVMRTRLAREAVRTGPVESSIRLPDYD